MRRTTLETAMSTLEMFCQRLATKELTNGQRALALLLWFRSGDASSEVPLSHLVQTLRTHALGNPKAARLKEDLRRSAMTLAGKAGYRLRADKVAIVTAMFADILDSQTVLPTSSPAPIGRRRSVPRAESRKREPKPSIFIGTSVEGLSVGSALHSGLEYECEPTRWDHGVFGPNRAPLHSLISHAKKSDFAVIVLTPDDVTQKRGEATFTARDNCIFELGLFMGALGPDRCFFVHSRDLEMGLPSDLEGLVTLTYPLRSDGNLRGALQTAIDSILIAVKSEGILSKI
jgi:predicted nucleotide-binding protein